MNSFNPLSAYNNSYLNKDALSSPLSIDRFKNTVTMLNVTLEEPVMENLKLFREKLLDKTKELLPTTETTKVTTENTPKGTIKTTETPT
jgi:hypothetical protein